MPSFDRAVRTADATSISLTGTHLTLVIVVAVIAVVALVMGVSFRRQVLAADPGTARMQEIGNAVEEGAQAYLARQFKTLSVFVVIVFFLLLALPADTAGVRWGRSGFFILGAVFSATIGYLGMSLAVKANVRVASAAREGDREGGMRIAFRTGGTVGMATVGLGLLGASVVVLVYKGEAPKVLEGFGFGAALLAMFMRVGGGIFTKAADVGADLVGKVEAGIPEDDPRNAATIADNVGDNVGDCAGMAADLFESYAVTLVAALILGKAAFGEQGLVLPLLIPAVGALTAVLGVFITRVRGDESGLAAINRGFYISAAFSAVLSGIVAYVYLPSTIGELTGVNVAQGSSLSTVAGKDPRLLATLAVLLGIVLAAVILWLTGHFTGTDKRPTKDVARTSLTGAATVVLAGIGVGFESAVYTAVIIGGAVYVAFLLGAGSIALSLFLIALAGCGLLTTVGVIVAMDTFGPVSDNAQGIAEMSGDIDADAAKILTDLDAVGNTTKAITKGIAIATAVLAATALFGSYTDAWQTAVATIGLTEEPTRVRPVDVQPADRGTQRAVRPDPRRRSGVHVLRPRDQRRHPGGRRHRVRGAPPVPRAPRHHGLHREAGVRPRRRHLHQGLAARAGHPRPAGRDGADRRGLRPRHRPPRRLPRRSHRHRRPHGGLPGELRRVLGQREEDRRGRRPRWQGLRGARGDRHRRHRR